MANHNFLNHFIITSRTKVKNKSKVEMAKEYKFMIPKDKILQMIFKRLIEQARNYQNIQLKSYNNKIK